MKITICGSMYFANEMLEVQEKVEELGHEVLIPSTTEECVEDKTLNENVEFCVENAVLDDHFKKIEESDAVLVLNYDKNGVSGYIGGNTLIEMGLAYYLNKKIFLLNPMPNKFDLRHATEVAIMQPTILNGDLNILNGEKMKLILASKSPRRKQLMELLGLDFDVIVSNADEDGIQEQDPAELTKKLAQLKAEVVAKQVENALVVGADSLVYFDSQTIGKPKGETDEEKREDAKRIIRNLSGKTHEVFTGVCIINTKTGQIIKDHCKTNITFRELSEKDIENAVKNDVILGGAGAYTPETHPILFEKVDGSYFNVNGLPTEKIIPILREQGVEI